MDKNGKKYLWLSLITFMAFLLEYFALFVIEMLVLKMDIMHYTAHQRSVHHWIMVVLWLIYLGLILLYTYKQHSFSIFDRKKKSSNNILIVLICFVGCKIMTFLDWHTLKVIGEAHGKTYFQFISQYMYYILEVVIVLLIIIYAQKAFDIFIKKESSTPFGGIVLALTWGMFHFVSRGVGLEIWNGISCMIFSILAGIMYVKLDRDYLYSYLFIALGYLL